MTPQVDLTDPVTRSNPYAAYAKLRREAPIARAQIRGMGSTWVLSRYDDVAQALKDPRLYNDRAHANGEDGSRDKWWLPSMLTAIERSMVMQDDPNHRRLRSLVHQAFTPKMIEQMSGHISDIANTLLTDAARQGTVNLIESFSLPLPLIVISEMMGVPEEDRFVFRTLIEGFNEGSSLGEHSFVSVAKAIPRAIRLARFFRKLVKLRQSEPGDDVTSRLLLARAEGHAQLSHDEVVAMLFLLLFAGHETTVNLVASGTLALLQHPDQLALLREKPELIGSAVEELLRYTSPAEHTAPRYLSEDIEYHGVRIRAKEWIIPLVASANRDEAAFERPEEIDITRNPNKHVAFGLGVHFCLGAPLARLEGKIAMQELIQRFPNMRLAVPQETLKWRTAPGLRALQALPMHLS